MVPLSKGRKYAQPTQRSTYERKMEISEIKSNKKLKRVNLGLVRKKSKSSDADKNLYPS